MANTASRGQQRDKPFRDALRMEIAEAGDDQRSLRAVARRLIANALDSDPSTSNAAILQIADRLDGKVAQPHGGDDELPPIGIKKIEIVIVDPQHRTDQSDAADQDREGV